MPDALEFREFQDFQDRSQSSGEPLGKAGYEMHELTTLSFNPWKTLGARGSPWLYCTVRGTGTLLRGCPESPYWLWWVWFHSHPQCMGLSVSFWISHKVKLLVSCCWTGVFVWEEGSRASYFAILLMSLLKILMVQIFFLNSKYCQIWRNYKEKSLQHLWYFLIYKNYF